MLLHYLPSSLQLSLVTLIFANEWVTPPRNHMSKWLSKIALTVPRFCFWLNCFDIHPSNFPAFFFNDWIHNCFCIMFWRVHWLYDLRSNIIFLLCFPSLSYFSSTIGSHVLALVKYSTLLTGLGVLVPTVWDPILVYSHQNKTGISNPFLSLCWWFHVSLVVTL